MSDEAASDEAGTDEQHRTTDTPPPGTPATTSVNLADNMDAEASDEPSISPEVEAAMEEGLERGTIREVDEPLEPPDEAAFEDDDEAVEELEADADEPDLPNVSGEQLDFEGLAEGDGEAEWTWGEPKPPRTFGYKGMQVVMTEPDDDDEILNLMRERSMDPGGEEEMTQLDRLKIYAKMCVDHPEITDERWEHKMTPTERLTIGTMAAQYLEGEDFTEAPEGGQTLPPG